MCVFTREKYLRTKVEIIRGEEEGGGRISKHIEVTLVFVKINRIFIYVRT